MAEVVNEDFEITITQTGTMLPGGAIPPALPDKVVKTDLTVIEANNAKANSKKILIDKMTQKDPAGMVATLGCKSPGAAAGSGADAPIPGKLGAVEIVASATKSKCDSKAVHLKGETGNCTCSVTYTPTGGSPVTVTGACTFEITNAGQTKVKAE